MLRRYVEQILSIYNYIDGVVVTNKKGIIEYYTTYRSEINNLKEEDVIGKHLLEVYPTLTEDTSSILRVLRDGKPIFNERQYLKTYKGQSIYAVNSTLPIKCGDNIIGAVDVSRYIEPDMQRQNITLSLKENVSLRDGNKLFSLNDIITNDYYMISVKDKIQRISKTDSSVLIYGKTGTGKELVAQAIHSHSRRVNSSFISQNCAAIPSTLLEGILFGTVKGAYTGSENRKGLFELAQGGTLFLDEINSMEISVQAKILKAIEEKTILRVGGLKPKNIDVRIISAVNEDPRVAIKENRLREDLFYRLGVVQINLPILKERKKDIKLLTNYFIQQLNLKMSRNIIGISENVETIFNNYPWPGNIRELKNVIEGAFNLTSNNLIQEKDLPDYILNSKKKVEKTLQDDLGKISLRQMIGNYEKLIINQALEQSKNMSDAARLLKISKQSLKYKIEKYRL